MEQLNLGVQQGLPEDRVLISQGAEAVRPPHPSLS